MGILNSALYWWGFRYWGASASVDFTSGKVSQFSYHLMLSPMPSGYLGDALLIAVGSSKDFAARDTSA